MPLTSYSSVTVAVAVLMVTFANASPSFPRVPTSGSKESLHGVPGNRKSTIPESSWGGQGISLKVEATESFIEFDCAHATIKERIKTDRHGRFIVKGIFVRESGVSSRVNTGQEREVVRAGINERKVIFSGKLKNKTMKLTMRFVGGDQNSETFHLTKDVTPELHKCL